MTKGIRLHPEKGLNPHLAICPNCGKDNGEIVLLGNQSTKWQCQQCNGVVIAASKSPERRKQGCPRCHAHNFTKLGDITGNEKIPGSLCKSCQDAQNSVDEAVAAGGVYWKCKDCHSEGALKAESVLAQKVREQLNILPPKPCGIEFDKTTCPICSVK